MNNRLVILILVFCAMSVHAQSFLRHLQTKVPGEGVITVHEDTKIDELVNNLPGVGNSQTFKKNVKYKPSEKTYNATTKGRYEEEKNVSKTEKADSSNTEKEDVTSKGSTLGKSFQGEVNDDEGMEIPTLDLRKKVMRNSYKIDGYRIQVYAGGNSRKARQAAEQAGNKVKMQFPDQPVYTHFYPPRWICRIGNFRSFEEASRMLLQIKKLGYNEACIVKGKISVQY